MNRYAQLYYILFFLLIMGAFASMAQNSYGLTILGMVGISFALIFLWRGVSLVKKRGFSKNDSAVELFCLSVISVLLSLRILYVRIPGVEILLIVAVAILIALYLRKIFLLFGTMFRQQPKPAVALILFYLSLVIFLLALGLMPFYQAGGELLGTIAFVILLGDIIYCLLSGTSIVNGVKETGFSLIFKLKDHSLLICSVFFLLSLYLGLNRVQVLPGIYSDEYPQAYFKMIDAAGAQGIQKKEQLNTSVEFKDQYERFLNRNHIGEQ